MRVLAVRLAIALILILISGVVHAQETDTPTPEPTAIPTEIPSAIPTETLTATPDVSLYVTIGEQTGRIDYVVSGGDLLIGLLLLLLLFSVWGFAVLQITTRGAKRD